ncbi:PTS transporter subunit EIIC [Demequina sp. SO4-18]|uniref:PTS transporter subunit EIIC n=1 Tax=Demequina sp. SO4-18 TaxID=3401026 RepID=UPI003B5C968D
MSFSDAQDKARANKNRTGAGIGTQVQRLGRFMSAMIMPNIGAFVAWGLITALFIESGWLNLGGDGNVAPDSWIASVGGWGDFAGAGIVGPMITYLLPLLIGYMGGRLVYETRGAVIGAVATMGVIVGSDVPMFLGAMIIGPFAAWCLKRVEATWQGKIKPGFEMLVDNFSLGILGGLLAVLGKMIIGPIVSRLVEWAGEGVDFLVENSLLPLASIVVEPAKILFLNNAINHGVFTPLGTAEAEDSGKSLLFMIESNPGPGLGILVAFMLFGPRMLKAAAPGAGIIHFFGGIHEVYFPFVLAKPKLIAAVILGGMTGVLVGVMFNGGLVAPPSPGSIFAWIAFTPPGVGNYVVMFAQVLLAATVSFFVASMLLGFGREARREDAPEDDSSAEATSKSTTPATV